MSDHETVPDGPAQLRINEKLYDVPTDFKLSEGLIVERMTGKTIHELDMNSASALAAMVYIILRREDPSITEAVLDWIDIEKVEPVEEEADAAGPPAEASGSPATPETEETQATSGAPA